MKPTLALLVSATMIVYFSASQAGTVIQNKGSDTSVTVIQARTEKHQEIEPDVAVLVSGGGSGTGTAALTMTPLIWPMPVV